MSAEATTLSGAGARLAARPDGELPVAVAEHGTYEGLLSFRGGARIDGTVRGRIEAHGVLWIGPHALVEAEVAVDQLVVEGELRGELRIRERATLLATARVQADLDVPRVSLADGCVLEGRCRTRSASDGCGPFS